MFNPNSPQAKAMVDLFWLSMAIGGAIFALVAGLVLYVVIRFRQRGDQAEPRQVSGNTKLEISWTVAPIVLLAGLFIVTIVGMRFVDPEADRPPDIVVTGYQWWWKVEYPQTGIVTANEIHIPVGKQILVRLEANDVIHSFWVPELAPKRDMVPGVHTNTIWMAANEPGIYRGWCTEFCGVQHAKMRILVVAQPQAEFDAWLQQMQRPASVPAGLPALGAELFRELTCVNCHAVTGGSGAAGAGPNLAHFGSRRTNGAGVLPNTPENLAQWILNPSAVKPGVYMPGYELSQEELIALVAYLETLQ